MHVRGVAFALLAISVLVYANTEIGVKQAQATGSHNGARHSTTPDPARDGNSGELAAAVITTALTGMAAAAAGIGGGGVLVPLFHLILSVSLQFATYMAQVTIAGGAIVNVAMFGRRRHPRGFGSLIDFDMIVLMMPALLIGTMLGVLAGAVFPEILTALLLIIALLLMAWRTLRKGRGMLRAEMSLRESLLPRDAASAEVKPASSNALADFANGKASPDTPLLPRKRLTRKARDRSIQISKEDAKLFPKKKVMMCAASWVVMLCMAIVRDGNGVGKLPTIECGSGGFWAVTGASAAILAVFTLLVARWLHLRYEAKALNPDLPRYEQFAWTSKNCVVFPLVGVFTGAIAGALGLGGGMVTGPLFLEFNMDARVSAATSAVVVLVTSTSTSAQVLIGGNVPLTTALVFALVGFFSALAGQNIVNAWLERRQQLSMIAFMLSGLLALAAILMGYTGIDRAVNYGWSGFQPLCANS